MLLCLGAPEVMMSQDLSTLLNLILASASEGRPWHRRRDGLIVIQSADFRAVLRGCGLTEARAMPALVDAGVALPSRGGALSRNSKVPWRQESVRCRVFDPERARRMLESWQDQQNDAVRTVVPVGDYVYFVQHEEKGPIKIGFSSDPVSRLQSLQTGNPYDLTLIGVVPGSMAHEAKLHATCSKARVQGEWFWPTAEVLAVIEKELGSWGAIRLK